MAVNPHSKTASRESAIFSDIDRMSKEFGKAARHVVAACRQSFIKISSAFEDRDYASCASIFDDLRNSRLIRDIGIGLSNISEKIDTLRTFLSRRLGPFIELVIGASLVAILPAAGGAAIGVALSVGAMAGAAIGILLVFVGILIMVHALLKMPD